MKSGCLAESLKSRNIPAERLKNPAKVKRSHHQLRRTLAMHVGGNTPPRVRIRPSPLFSLRFFGFFGESIVNARGANLSRICGHSYVLMYIDSLVNTRLRAFIHALSRALGRAGG